MAVLDPVKVVITNYPADKRSYLKLKITKKMKRLDSEKYLFRDFYRKRGFSKILSQSFFRLSIGNEVRLKMVILSKENQLQKNSDGMITECMFGWW
jgi:glutaminyl-tRNA synthetase